MPVNLRFLSITSVLCALAIMAACASRDAADGPPENGAAGGQLPADAIPRNESKSRYGNPPSYEVHGQRYHVLDSSDGYQERGVASWYGEKFHGRRTSSGEIYDMYQMTAAHKTLPLPTYVQVTNLRNQRSITVRVNDRGPFVSNRIIDLSYSAAQRLGIVEDGTSLVDIRVVGSTTAAASAHAGSKSAIVAAPDKPTSAIAPKAADESVATRLGDQSPAADTTLFLQVGAFSDRENAQRRHNQLLTSGVTSAFIFEDTDAKPNLFRVRVGPIGDVAGYDSLVQQIEAMGITESHIVTQKN